MHALFAYDFENHLCVNLMHSHFRFARDHSEIKHTLMQNIPLSYHTPSSPAPLRYINPQAVIEILSSRGSSLTSHLFLFRTRPFSQI